MVTSLLLYVGLLAVVAGERVAELLVSRANARRSFALGAREHGRGHYPVMVALHTAFLVAAVLEPVVFHRPFVAAVGWPALALVVLAQALRWWVIGTLGYRWNTRVLVIPGGERVTAGPFRWFSHPNYVAVVVEGIALPLVHSAWFTAIAFTVLNLLVLRERIRVEDVALQSLGKQR